MLLLMPPDFVLFLLFISIFRPKTNIKHKLKIPVFKIQNVVRSLLMSKF